MEHVLMRELQHWVAPRAGWVEARGGSLWVTRSGDLQDHLLDCGERLAVARGDDLVLQALRRDVPAAWDWQPRAAAPGEGWRRMVAARARAGWARALRAVAAGLAALARSAAASAGRAQACTGAAE
jgi:hypothetical protein